MRQSVKTRSSRPRWSAGSPPMSSTIRKWAPWRSPSRRSPWRRFRGPRSSRPTASGSAFRPARVDGLVYGEDPSEGFVRGRRFVHPRLGFTFLAPSGFALDNTAQAVLGVNQGGGEALRLDVVQVPAEQSLADYLGSGWIENI